MKHFYIPTLLTFTLQTQSFHLPSLGSLIHHSPQKTNTAASQASKSVAPEPKLPLPQTTPQPQQPCGSAHASSPTQMGHCIPSTDKSSCYWLNDWRCGWGSVCCWEKRQDLDGIVEGDGKAEFEDRGVVVETTCGDDGQNIGICAYSSKNCDSITESTECGDRQKCCWMGYDKLIELQTR